MHLLSLAAVLAMGLVTVAGVAIFPELAVMFVGGPEYVDLQDRLWLFALLGTVLALIQLMIYDVVARQHQRTVLVVWAALVVLLCSTPFVDRLGVLLTVVLSVDTLLFAVLVVASLRRRAPLPAPPVLR